MWVCRCTRLHPFKTLHVVVLCIFPHSR
jgi:hypothetical protein